MNKFLKVISRIWLFPSRVLAVLCAPIVSFATSFTEDKVTIAQAFEVYRLGEEVDTPLAFLSAIPSNCFVLSLFFPFVSFLPLLLLSLIRVFDTFYHGFKRFRFLKFFHASIGKAKF